MKKLYILVSAFNQHDFQHEVNEVISKGYVPLGAPFREQGVFYQAMVSANLAHAAMNHG